MHGTVKGLAGKGLVVQRTIVVAIKKATEFVFELLHPNHRGFTESHRHRLVRQPLATDDGIHEMTLDRITRAQRHVIATLHHARTATFAE